MTSSGTSFDAATTWSWVANLLDYGLVGGMIVHDQILPSLYQLQRTGRIGEITVCDARRRAVEALAKADGIARAFPGQSFRAVPDSGEERVLGDGVAPIGLGDAEMAEETL